MSKKTLITGFPRIGENRELKRAVESYWNGKSTIGELEDKAGELREKHWLEQKKRGIGFISINDFSLYDNMLDTVVMLNAVPKRFIPIRNVTERYFAMARGVKEAAAMEMTKWFNTNYHYIVPELENDMEFHLNPEKILKEYHHAKSLGIHPKINIIGPITFTALSKMSERSDTFSFFNRIFEVYKSLVNVLSELDEEIYLQIEEPIFVKDPCRKYLDLLNPVYNGLSSLSTKIKIIVTTYFENSCEAVEELAGTGIWGVGLDFINGRDNLSVLDWLADKHLVAGVVDGRNIWRNDLQKTKALLCEIAEKIDREKIIVSTSCSLLHIPYTVKNEPENDMNRWFSFAIEKIEEVVLVDKLFRDEPFSSEEEKGVVENMMSHEERKKSELITCPYVTERVRAEGNGSRKETAADRFDVQKKLLDLPSIPTTTIGSFPQTPEIRRARRDYKMGRISCDEYEEEMRKYIDECIHIQEVVGLDVLVHGEPERNDMVEYFGEQLKGFHFTSNGWVQSYGSRCVKPPIIYGDISRKEPMTINWIGYAQSRTKKIMKGMLTGPVTIINWSFVRDDLSRSEISKQIALALADEIDDLQNRAIKIIQVDEAAFKEGYPLRMKNIPEYEEWAVNSFKLTVSKARKETQIHTHMCYSEFNDIIETIELMDADVITIETARSGNRLLNIFKEVGYSKGIGPGVYDIHSPRIPSIEEYKGQIEQRLEVIDSSLFWVNPDCGLKTRRWEEVKPALENMVKAVREIREIREIREDGYESPRE